jgi:hypothetical protein
LKKQNVNNIYLHDRSIRATGRWIYL